MTRKKDVPWFHFTRTAYGTVVCTLGPYGDMESSRIFELHDDYMRTFERDFEAFMVKRSGR